MAKPAKKINNSPIIEPLPMQASEARAPDQRIAIGYCGLKPEQDDPVAGTKLVWCKGIVHEVNRAQAAILLNHPGIWFDAREHKHLDPVKPSTLDRRTLELETPEHLQASILPPMVRMDKMTEPELRRFAIREYGERFPEGMKPPEILRKLNEYSVGRQRSRF